MTPLLAQRPRSDRAFERLYKKHVGDVYRYALAVMRNPTDAEDVTQTTFLNADRSYVEIAEILEVSTSAVETLIFRARRALREQLEGTLTCGEAEFAISRQLDGRLPRQERGQLRAHLRECGECASFARRQRAQRGALKTLALVPVPGSLSSFFGGGAAVGTGLGIKAAAAITAGLVIGGAGYEGDRHSPLSSDRPAAAVPSTP